MAAATRRMVMAGALAASAAWAQDTPQLLVAGAAMSAMQEIARTVTPAPRMAFDTVGALRQRVEAGARPDLLIVSRTAMRALIETGRVPEARVRPIGRTGVGLAAPRNAPPTPIDTPERLRAVLLATPSLGWGDPARGATAATHFQRVLGQLGILDELRPRIRTFPFGAEAVAAAGRGELALAVSQATEILIVSEVQLVGLLPDALQLWTEYDAAAVAGGPAGEAWLARLATPEARAAFARAGFR